MANIAKAKKIRIKRTVSLEQIAENLAHDIVGAIYTAIGNKVVYELRSGEDLDEVVDQALDKSGMSETLTRLNKTRLEFNIAMDCSGSMFDRFDNVKPIVPASTTLRVLLRALQIVSDKLPQDVFKFSLWLFAVWSGHEFVCLSHDGFNDDLIRRLEDAAKNYYRPPSSLLPFLKAPKTFEAIDALLSSLSTTEPDWAGSGTSLSPLLERFVVWNTEAGDPSAHKLDIVITDGALHDVDKCSNIQTWRIVQKYEAVLLQVGNKITRVPNGFTLYNIRPTEVGETIRDFLLGFVQRL